MKTSNGDHGDTWPELQLSLNWLWVLRHVPPLQCSPLLPSSPVYNSEQMSRVRAEQRTAPPTLRVMEMWWPEMVALFTWSSLVDGDRDAEETGDTPS